MSKILRNLGFAAIMAVAASALIPSQASALSMAECSVKFKASKAAGTDAGMKWNDFRKTQCSAEAAAVAAPAVPAAPVIKAAAPVAKAAAPAAPADVAAAPATSGGFMKECSAAWKGMKAAGTVPAGMKYRDFVAAKCVVSATPAMPATKAAAPVAPAAPAAPVTKAAAPVVPMAPAAKGAASAAPVAPAVGAMVDKNGKPMSPGRAAMVTRERACGAKWKAMKADGTRPADQTWPQFWSACNKELKAQAL